MQQSRSQAPLDAKEAEQLPDATPLVGPATPESPVNGPATAVHEDNKDADNVHVSNDGPVHDPNSSLVRAADSDSSGSTTPSSPARKAGMDSKGGLDSCKTNPSTPSPSTGHSLIGAKRRLNSPAMAQTPKASRVDSPKKLEEEGNPDGEVTQNSGNAVEEAVETGKEKAVETARVIEADVDVKLDPEQEGEGAVVVTDRGTEANFHPPDSGQNLTPTTVPNQVISGDQGAPSPELIDRGNSPPHTTEQPNSTENLLSQTQH